ncbi:helix-turn-helix domain-containing protein [Nocardiopsis sediminis]|uniref:Helix-turn-helix domain-containing protein n=1 Tax=Nocardiopsis sediminis TaxID=1778267 RepID=A0ABV8FMQ3_9ACTN
MSDPSDAKRVPIPSAFWTRGEVQVALSREDAGALLRLVRQRTGASQHAIGAAIDMAQPHVSGIMRGRREVTALKTWRRIADGLSMPNEARRMIGLADSDWVYEGGIRRSSPLSSPPGDLWSAPRMVRDAAEMTLRDLMKRREALAAGGALVVGTALTETLEHWLLPTDAGPLGRRTIGDGELMRIEAATVAMRHWDDRWKLGIRRKAVLGQLSEVAELAEVFQPEPVRSRLFMVMAELAKISASMSYDAGDHPSAQEYYTLALRFAHQAGPEHRLYGVGVLADMARQMLDLKRPQDALEISRLALDSAQAHAAPGIVLALLRTREGWSYARVGRAEAWRRSVAQAEDLLDNEDGSSEVPEWARSFDRAELAGVVGARYRDLAAGTEDRAARTRYATASADYITQALRLRAPEKLRNRAFDLIGLGRTYLVLGEPGEAASAISRAASLERTIGSGRVRRRLHDWYTESAAYHRDPAIAQLRDELATTLLDGQSNLKETA